MKILLLDADAAHNKKISSAFDHDSKVILHPFTKQTDLVEVLNGNPALEVIKKDLEKSAADAAAMAKVMGDSLEELKGRIKTLQAELDAAKQATPQTEQVNQIAGQISQLEMQFSKGDEVRVKAEGILRHRQTELANIQGQIVKPENKKASLVLVDRSFLGNNPQDWITEFRHSISNVENNNVSVVIMGYNDDIDYIKKTLVAGIADYFVKPVDILMLKHNAIKIAGGKIESDQKVYELQAESELKILRLGMTKKMSEFELDVETDNSFLKDEIVEFYADAFSGEKGRRILGRCLTSEPSAATKGKFLTHFSFVGLSPHLMNELRKWLKLHYISSKNKG